MRSIKEARMSLWQQKLFAKVGKRNVTEKQILDAKNEDKEACLVIGIPFTFIAQCHNVIIV